MRKSISRGRPAATPGADESWREEWMTIQPSAAGSSRSRLNTRRSEGGAPGEMVSGIIVAIGKTCPAGLAKILATRCWSVYRSISWGPLAGPTRNGSPGPTLAASSAWGGFHCYSRRRGPGGRALLLAEKLKTGYIRAGGHIGVLRQAGTVGRMLRCAIL